MIHPTRRSWIVFLSVLILMSGWGTDAVAQEADPSARVRPVEVLREWRGRVGLERSVRPVSFVADGGALKTLWEELGLAGPVPPVDFERHLLLVGVVRSSLVMCMEPVVDDRGDLKPSVVATPDQPAFRSYALCLVERAGIRSVGGVPL